MKYVIEYEHLKDELVTNRETEYHFKVVKDNANKYKLELSDDDFKRFFKLKKRGEDIRWLMHKMSAYDLNLTDALIAYIHY